MRNENHAAAEAFSNYDQRQEGGGTAADSDPHKGNGIGAATDRLGIWDAGDDDYATIPPRGWLLGTAFCRRFLSSLLADGGVGKTAVRVAQLISLASGRSLTGEYIFQRCRVLIMSFEDDRDELRRRVYAVLRHHDITPAQVRGWLFLAAPKGLKLAEIKDGAPQIGALDKLLRDEIETRKLDVISLDPFVKTHRLAENDNNAIDFVCELLTTLGIEKNCAVDSPHHTRKGLMTPGNADAGRGASSMKDAGRLVYTLTPMSEDEAKQFGLSEDDRRSLIRMDSGKVNIAPPSRAAKWFRLIGVPLGNGNAVYPNGDEVQTVEPWTPPDTWEGLNSPLLEPDSGRHQCRSRQRPEVFRNTVRQGRQGGLDRRARHTPTSPKQLAATSYEHG